MWVYSMIMLIIIVLPDIFWSTRIRAAISHISALFMGWCRCPNKWQHFLALIHDENHRKVAALLGQNPHTWDLHCLYSFAVLKFNIINMLKTGSSTRTAHSFSSSGLKRRFRNIKAAKEGVELPHISLHIFLLLQSFSTKMLEACLVRLRALKHLHDGSA